MELLKLSEVQLLVMKFVLNYVSKLNIWLQSLLEEYEWLDVNMLLLILITWGPHPIPLAPLWQDPQLLAAIQVHYKKT